MDIKGTSTQNSKRPPRHAKGEDFCHRYVNQWLNSDLSRSQYCRAQKLAGDSFVTWKIRFVGPDIDKPPVQKKPILLPVRIERKTPPFTIEIVINGSGLYACHLIKIPKPLNAILDAFKRWVENQIDAVLPKNPLGKALFYMLNHWDSLNRYLDEGFLKPKNNKAEQHIRPVDLGGKNFLFVGSDRGGKAAATYYSFIESCKN